MKVRKQTFNKSLWTGAGLFLALAILPASVDAQGKADLLKDALSAAWPGMAEDAKVVDWEGGPSIFLMDRPARRPKP